MATDGLKLYAGYEPGWVVQIEKNGGSVSFEQRGSYNTTDEQLTVLFSDGEGIVPGNDKDGDLSFIRTVFETGQHYNYRCAHLCS